MLSYWMLLLLPLSSWLLSAYPWFNSLDFSAPCLYMPVPELLMWFEHLKLYILKMFIFLSLILCDCVCMYMSHKMSLQWNLDLNMSHSSNGSGNAMTTTTTTTTTATTIDRPGTRIYSHLEHYKYRFKQTTNTLTSSILINKWVSSFYGFDIQSFQQAITKWNERV